MKRWNSTWSDQVPINITAYQMNLARISLKVGIFMQDLWSLILGSKGSVGVPRCY